MDSKKISATVNGVFLSADDAEDLAGMIQELLESEGEIPVGSSIDLEGR